MLKIYNFSPLQMALNFLLVMMSSGLLAQASFSYVSDRKFLRPNEIIGYTFCPELIGFQDGDKSRLSPGEICFNISRSYLLVKGDPIEGAYSINAIKAEKYGYRMELMDANDPSKQGYLKIYLNQDYQVDVLVLRQSGKADELVFYQAILPEDTEAEESNYFTDRNEVQLHNLDSIWGKTIRPLHILEGSRQIRLQMKDSLEVKFTSKTIGEGKKEKTIFQVETRSFRKSDENEAEEYTEETDLYEVKKIRLLTSQLESDAEQRYFVELTSKEAPGGVIGVYLNQAKGISMIEIGGTRMLMRGY